MRRLFVLFLIFLLPLQVFAGIANDRLEHLAERWDSAAYPSAKADARIGLRLAATLLQQDAIFEKHAAAEDAPCDEPAEDLGNHATFGDEAVPAGILIFAVHSPIFISSLHDDAAPIPPYLPPAARPPQA